jgi:hypothetical protein
MATLRAHSTDHRSLARRVLTNCRLELCDAFELQSTIEIVGLFAAYLIRRAQHVCGCGDARMSALLILGPIPDLLLRIVHCRLYPLFPDIRRHSRHVRWVPIGDVPTWARGLCRPFDLVFTLQ